MKLGFEIGLPVNETQFSKTPITKNDNFSRKLMLILVNIDGNCIEKTGTLNTSYIVTQKKLSSRLKPINLGYCNGGTSYVWVQTKS